jgi:uncharacterized protein YjbJ (UPF0337 family)
LTNIISWPAESQGGAVGAVLTFAKTPNAQRRSRPAVSLPTFNPLIMMCETPKNTTGKVLLTALAGAGVGALTGILLYSKKGMARRQHFRNFRTDQRLRLRDDWNLLKGKLQQTYNHLTDEDLSYVEGKGHELISRLQAKLGKRKRQIVKILNAL